MVLEKARHRRYQTKGELSRKKKTVIDTNNVFLKDILLWQCRNGKVRENNFEYKIKKKLTDV